MVKCKNGHKFFPFLCTCPFVGNLICSSSHWENLFLHPLCLAVANWLALANGSLANMMHAKSWKMLTIISQQTWKNKRKEKEKCLNIRASPILLTLEYLPPPCWHWAYASLLDDDPVIAITFVNSQHLTSVYEWVQVIWCGAEVSHKLSPKLSTGKIMSQ